MLAVLSAGLVLVEAQFALHADDAEPLSVILYVSTMSLFLAAGLIAWRMRPTNRIGVLMMLTGMSLWLAGLADAPLPSLATLGIAGRSLPLALTLHLLLAFPSGRVRGRLDGWLVVTGYLASTLLQVPSYLMDDGALAPIDGAGAGVVTVTGWIQTGIGALSLLGASALVAARAVKADQVDRRLLGPMLWYRILAPLAITGTALSIRLAGSAEMAEPARTTQLVVLLCLPLVFLVGLLFGSFGRAGALDETVARIGAATPSPDELSAAVASALGDPEAMVVYARDDGSYVAADGHEPVLSRAGSRALHPVRHGDRTVGAIVYRPGLIADQSVMEILAGIAAMAIDQQRLEADQLALVAELRDRQDELHRSRQRLLHAADSERRRIARDLHDGAQQHIVLLGLMARRLSRHTADPAAARSANEIADGLSAVLADFRDLIAGIIPTPLLERGLVPAVELLAQRMPIPTVVTATGSPFGLATEAETTAYFVISEALTNVVKHSSAATASVLIDRSGDHLRVSVSDDGSGGAEPSGGSGILGLSDRIATLGGSILLRSHPTGTTLEADFPCA